MKSCNGFSRVAHWCGGGGEEDGGLNEVQGEGLVRMYGGEEEGVGAGRR